MSEFRIPSKVRGKTSIYLDTCLWRDFVSWCKSNHLSTCGVIEPLLYALLKGSSELSLSAIPKIDMQLNVTREVSRYRRKENVRDGPLFDDWGTHLHCRFCKHPSRWVVYYAEGWDKTIRVYCCGNHVRPYRRMISLEKGFPQVRFQRLYQK